ncbi:hypothetical protein N8Z18_00575 [bacterium]|nr:hypothetical protein [bacterium]
MIDVLLGGLLEEGNNMENGDNNDTGIVEKAGIGLFAIMMWCSTGGLMLLHIISVFAGATTWVLGFVGFFIPPVGLLNGLIFILTGDSLEQYF